MLHRIWTHFSSTSSVKSSKTDSYKSIDDDTDKIRSPSGSRLLSHQNSLAPSSFIPLNYKHHGFQGHPNKKEKEHSLVSSAMVSNYNDNHSFVIKAPCVFEAAFQEILQLLKQNGEMSMEHGVAIIRKYEIAAETARHFFPGAEPSRRVLGIVKNELAKHNILPENTLFAESICPDEINHTNGGIANVFKEHFGDGFHLGGLAGIPFTGATGFTAFSHHVPDDGNLFILFAPHIGLSETNKFGQFSRRGQHKEGAACGAAVGALNHCIACKPIPTNETLGASPIDYQMNYIISQVSKRLECIQCKDTDNEVQVELAKQMFEISKAFLELFVNTDFGSQYSKLILLGGIQINMPGPQTDFFQPLFFEIRHRHHHVGDAGSNIAFSLSSFLTKSNSSPSSSGDSTSSNSTSKTSAPKNVPGTSGMKVDLLPVFQSMSASQKRLL